MLLSSDLPRALGTVFLDHWFAAVSYPVEVPTLALVKPSEQLVFSPVPFQIPESVGVEKLTLLDFPRVRRQLALDVVELVI